MPGAMSSLSLTRLWFFGFPHGGANGLRLTVPSGSIRVSMRPARPFPCPREPTGPANPSASALACRPSTP
jgi:hypothetical protein